MALSFFSSEKMYKASSLALSQSLMAYMFKVSNGNVSIQSHNYPSYAEPGGVADELRLYCTECTKSKILDISLLANETLLMPELDWGTQHRHDGAQAAYTAPEQSVKPVKPIEPTGERKLKIVL
jgi:hypothetical protein